MSGVLNEDQAYLRAILKKQKLYRLNYIDNSFYFNYLSHISPFPTHFTIQETFLK